MKQLRKNWLTGFTLMELMIVIAILGVLAAMISGNFITSLKKGRDARRKGDLEQIQRALEMYYEDKKAYPTAAATAQGFVFGDKFADDVSGKVYMQQVSNDPLTGNNYVYDSNGTYYRLYSCIENELDQGAGVIQDPGYTEKVCGSSKRCKVCRYGISSPNTTP